MTESLSVFTFKFSLRVVEKYCEILDCSCSQCSFTAQFESALVMHRQLHHEPPIDWNFKSNKSQEKSKTIPRTACDTSFRTSQEPKTKLGRTSSATRLFEKLRGRIFRSKTLFAHPEEDTNNFNDLSGQSECTSKALKDLESSLSGVLESPGICKESYACHLCSFDADRITVLDRHLLNDHKISLENLLKLVMSKTKDGLSEENSTQIHGVRQPYYKQTDEVFENGEFVIETVTPKIKMFKHTASNTDLKWTEIPDSKIDTPLENDKNLLLSKIEILNECMCKFVDSSNTLKKVLTKELDHKSLRNQSEFALGLGDQDSPRDWEKAHSEKLERNRTKHPENRCGDHSRRMKMSALKTYVSSLSDILDLIISF